MKANKRGAIDLMHFPTEETKTVIEAMRQAEQAADPAALKWCARRVIRLFGLFEDDVCESDEPYIPVKVFNEIWETELKHDPVPDSIAAVINPPPPPEPPPPPKPRLRDNTSIDFAEYEIKIGNRSDALALLDDLIDATMKLNFDVALEALKDAITREII